MAFEKWIDTLIEEKGINTEQRFDVQGEIEMNSIPVGCVIEAIKNAPEREQIGIKKVLVQIDFMNGDILDYLKHLAKAIAI